MVPNGIVLVMITQLNLIVLLEYISIPTHKLIVLLDHIIMFTTYSYLIYVVMIDKFYTLHCNGKGFYLV